MSTVPDRRYEPKVVVMFCQNAAAGVEASSVSRQEDGFEARLVVMPCSSKLEVLHLVKLLEFGRDGIELVGCPPDECRLQGGSRKAEKRVEYLRERLRRLDLAPERFGMTYGAGLSLEELVAIGRKRADLVRPLGPNRFRPRPAKVRA